MQSDIRNLWFGASLAFAAVLGIYSADFNRGLIDLVTFGVLDNAETAVLLATPAISFACGLVLVCLTAFILGFLGLAFFDIVLTALSRNRLNLLRKALYGEETPSREAFVDCFSLSPELSQAAHRHAEKLYVFATRKKQSGTPFTILRASQSSKQSFHSSVLIEQRLLVWFFRVFVPALIGTGIFAFAAVLATGTTAASPTPLTIAAVALAVAAFGAMVVAVGERAVTGFRRSQIASLCDDIDAVYRPSGESVSLEEIVRGSHESAELVVNATLATQEDFRATMQGAAKEIADKLEANATAIRDGLSETVKAQGSEISSAVAKALSEPIDTLKSATETATSKQGEQVSKLVKTALDSFVRELKSIVGDQFTQLDQLIKSSTDSAAKFEKVYADAVSTLAGESAEMKSNLIKEFKAVIDALKTEEAARVKAQTDSVKSVVGDFTAVIDSVKTEETKRAKAQTESIKAMTDQLSDSLKGITEGLGNSMKKVAETLGAETKEVATAMAADANRHAEEFNAALDRAIETVQGLAGQQLQQTTEDLGRTASAFDSLHTSLENIATLVTPMIRQVIENQESLLRAIESESSNSRVLSRAASEMSAAAQVSRTTVDRFLALAEVLRETSTNMGRAANTNLKVAPPPPPAVKPKKVASAKSGASKFGDAIRQLREASREESDDLPEIE